MILIEHATVLTLDAERRILSDGSVLKSDEPGPQAPAGLVQAG